MKIEDLKLGGLYTFCGNKIMILELRCDSVLVYDYRNNTSMILGADRVSMFRKHEEPIKKVVERELYLIADKNSKNATNLIDELIGMDCSTDSYNEIEQAKRDAHGSYYCKTIVKAKFRVEIEEVME